MAPAPDPDGSGDERSDDVDSHDVDSHDVEKLATRLFTMARQGDADALDAYVAAGVPVDLRNQSGDSLVMLAAYHGHAATVGVLLARGADPDLPNDKGQTPLAGAVFKGEDDVVNTLLAGGADPRAGQPTAVATAAMFGRTDHLERFGETPSPDDA